MGYLNESTMRELSLITTINGENIIDIIMSDREDDYVLEWRDRISEEIQTRIETGIITPINVLPWCVRGIGWKGFIKEEVPF